MSSSADTLRKFVLEEHGIRGVVVQMDAAWRAVLARHDYPAAVRGCVGELMAAAALLTATLAYRGTLALQLKGTGPIHWILAECTSDFGLRSTARWSGEVTGGVLGPQLGAARLSLTIDPAEGSERYHGIVAVERDDIAGVLEDYFSRSEQLPTWLYADAGTAGGLLLQQTPGAAGRDADAWDRAVHLAGTLGAQKLARDDAGDIIHRLFHEEDVRLFERVPLSFRCTCSRERVIRTLRLLGPGDIRPLLEERGEVRVDCEFCNQQYRFDAVDIEQIFAASLGGRGSSSQH